MRAFLLALIFTYTLASGFALAQTLLGVTFGRNAGTETPPSACAGVIDLSAGCPLPMLGL